MNQDLMNRIQAMMQQRGASGNGIMGYASGGGVPRQTEIRDEPHMLAYINPEEAQLLKDLGGTGEPGPGGIPAYRGQGAADPRQFGDTFTANRTPTFPASFGGSSGNSASDDASDRAAQKVREANRAAAASMLSVGVGSVGGTNYNDNSN